jgi:glucose/arabinose dehydrogenase/Mn2+/Fe2+ NRAMP family transporter/mono/diheme cytochrome c family protein
MSQQKWKTALMSLGPGMITAALVFGPSKITITSMLGATFGFDMLWIVVVAIFFMIIFTSMSSRIGLATKESLLTTISRKWGRGAGIVIGICVFLVTASFQAGNSIGTGLSVAEATHTKPAIWVIVFTGLAIALLFFRSFYKILEKIMIALIVLMLFAFVTTLLLSRPSVPEMAAGLTPSIPTGSWKLVIAFMASCFSIVGASYQAYLVQERRKLRPDLKQTGRESIPGMLILGLMSAMVMICAAAVLHSKGVKISSATDMAKALAPIFGEYATALFLAGLFGASFSSLIGNATLGGTLLGDALGYGGQLNSKMVRFLIALIMIIGAIIALAFGKLPLELIVLAQAVTIFVVPVIGIALYVLANDREIMGELRNKPFSNIAGALGLLIMIGLAISNVQTLLQPKESKTASAAPVLEPLELDSTMAGTSTVITDLNVPWEIAWGPDGQIWFTEQSGTVSKVDPQTGQKKILLTIPEVYRQRSLGLLGMAIHPDKKLPYVFVDYTHKKNDSVIVSRLVRYTYTADTLKEPLLLLEVPGNTGHNGSRVAVSPDGKVILSTGDAAHSAHAQDTGSLSGKTLRLNIDGTVPADNPIPGSFVWSRGHRNIQGLAFTPDGHFFAAEHGDATDDEINLIRKGANYGWPDIQGLADLPEEKLYGRQTTVTTPLRAWTPVIAPAGIDYYNSDKIPEWKNAILLVTLKTASLRALRLNETKDSIIDEKVYLQNKFGRLRDLCISPDGDLYLATSNRDWNPGKGFPHEHDDRIIKVTPTGQRMQMNRPQLAAVKALAPGEQLYVSYCASCHKEGGEGVAGSFPALRENEQVKGDRKTLINTVLQGKKSKQPEQMPAFAFLSDQQLADVLTYVRTAWGHHAGDITASQIAKARQ